MRTYRSGILVAKETEPFQPADDGIIFSQTKLGSGFRLDFASGAAEFSSKDFSKGLAGELFGTRCVVQAAQLLDLEHGAAPTNGTVGASDELVALRDAVDGLELDRVAVWVRFKAGRPFALDRRAGVWDRFVKDVVLVDALAWRCVERLVLAALNVEGLPDGGEEYLWLQKNGRRCINILHMLA